MTIALIIAHPYSASSQLADVLLAVACHLVIYTRIFVTDGAAATRYAVLLGNPKIKAKMDS